MGKPLSQGNKRLRASVLFAVAVEFAFIVFLTVFLSKHADPKGDGMEMVGASAAFVLIFLPFSLPALLLAKNGRFLMLAAILAGVSPPSSISPSGSKFSTSSVSRPRPRPDKGRGRNP